VVELLLENRPRSEQLTIHTIADSFNLEYEYSTTTRIVRISRLELFGTEGFVPGATADFINENLPYWGPLHENSGHEFPSSTDYDFAIAGRAAGDFSEANAMKNRDILADLALPPSNLDQSTDIPRPENPTFAGGTQSNLEQEIDELLSASHSVRENQPESLFHDHTTAVSEALLFEGTELQKFSSKDYTAREHPLCYAAPKADGLNHCPFEDDSNAKCTHNPEKLKCNHEYDHVFPSPYLQR